MNVVFTLAVFAVVFLTVMFIFSILMGKRSQLTRRLREIDKTAAQFEVNEIAAAADEKVWQSSLDSLVSKETKKKGVLTDRYFDYLAGKLGKANLLYRPKEFFLLSLGAALAIILIVFILFGGKYPGLYMGFGFVIMVVLTGAIGFMLPNIYLSFMAQRIKSLLSKQVGDFILLLSNYLRAGHSFIRSVELVSWELQSPLADELKVFVKDMNLGASFNEALDSLNKRTNDEDLGLVITAIQIHHQIGGNLSEILDNINHTIRERIRLKGEIRTLTAQGRMTAIIISLLPVVVAVLISLTSPDFMKGLFTDSMGQALLMVAIALEITGIIIIRKVIRIEV